MPWSGMPAGLLSTIAGLGGLAQGYGQGQDQSLQRALLMQKLQEQQKQDQLKQQLAAALFGAGARQPLAPVSGGMPQQPGAGMPGAGGSAGFGSGMPGGSLSPAPQQQSPQQQPNNQAMQIAALTQAMGGGGQSPQMRPPQAMGGGIMGQIPGRGTPQREGLVDLLIRDESGGRNINQQVVGPGGGYNPSTGGITGPSSASGLGQMIDSTWRGTPTAQQTGYRRMIDAPEGVQKEAINDQIDKRGLADWAPYNKKFAADAKDYLGGLDLPTGGAQQAQTASNQIMNTTPMSAAGSMTLDSLVDSINQRMPNASPEVKLAAMQMLTPLMAEQAKTEWDHHKWTVTEAGKKTDRAETERHDRAMEGKIGSGGQIFQDPETKQWYRASPMGEVTSVALPANAVKPGTQAQQMPAELQVPDKWEGMPDKAPPGVRQDVWQASLEYVRTGKMPALGFQAGLRNQILQASPGAAKALGVPASQVADLQAQYAGGRHAEIVGGGRAANIEFGIQEAKKAAPQVIATSKDVPRTEFPAANQFWNWIQESTGDPNIVAFKEALNTYLNVYAATVSRTGRLTDAQQRHAYELLSTNFAQGQIDRGIQQLDYEMSLMQESVEPAMENLKRLGQPPALKQPQTPATPPQQRQGQGGADQEGDTATGPDGKKMVYRNGTWAPAGQ